MGGPQNLHVKKAVEFEIKIGNFYYRPQMTRYLNKEHNCFTKSISLTLQVTEADFGCKMASIYTYKRPLWAACHTSLIPESSVNKTWQLQPYFRCLTIAAIRRNGQTPILHMALYKLNACNSLLKTAIFTSGSNRKYIKNFQDLNNGLESKSENIEILSSHKTPHPPIK
jgi:hypothetical protein